MWMVLIWTKLKNLRNCSKWNVCLWDWRKRKLGRRWVWPKVLPTVRALFAGNHCNSCNFANFAKLYYVYRFEKLDITPKSAQKIKPVLEKWIQEIDEKVQMGQVRPGLAGGAGGPVATGTALSQCHFSSLTLPTTLDRAGGAGSPGLAPVTDGVSSPPGSGGRPGSISPSTLFASHHHQHGHHHTSPLDVAKKRKRRTSFTPQALEILNRFFQRNTHPTGQY